MNENNFKDYYEILEVHKKASQDVVKRAYTILAKKYHPDLNRNNIEGSNRKMTELNEAYEILSDANKRYWYDQLHEYMSHSGINLNSRNQVYNTSRESRTDQYTVKNDYKSNIVKPSNISKRYTYYNENNTKLTILTYSAIALVVVYSLLTNIM